MTSVYTRLGSVVVSALLLFGAAPACSKSNDAPAADSSAASAEQTPAAGDKVAAGTGEASPTTTAPTSAAEAAGDTVVFEVTGTGTATTIDLVPAGDDERLYDVPLPWSTTISITGDVTQLQVVAVGSGATNPGCKITLNGDVVAEKPEGADAHCVFDR